MIISLGYRVKTKIATNFRQRATERLKEYMLKGFTIDDERLKDLGGGNYWKELLDRIRDIRSSEKVMYRQVLDLYATSVDYDPKNSESIAFLKWCRTNCIMLHMDIQEQKYGFKVHIAYIAEEKSSLGLTMYDAPDAVKGSKDREMWEEEDSYSTLFF